MNLVVFSLSYMSVYSWWYKSFYLFQFLYLRFRCIIFRRQLHKVVMDNAQVYRKLYAGPLLQRLLLHKYNKYLFKLNGPLIFSIDPIYISTLPDSTWILSITCIGYFYYPGHKCLCWYVEGLNLVICIFITYEESIIINGIPLYTHYGLYRLPL